MDIKYFLLEDCQFQSQKKCKRDEGRKKREKFEKVEVIWRQRMKKDVEMSTTLT